MIGVDLDVKRGFFAVLRHKVGWDDPECTTTASGTRPE